MYYGILVFAVIALVAYVRYMRPWLRKRKETKEKEERVASAKRIRAQAKQFFHEKVQRHFPLERAEKKPLEVSFVDLIKRIEGGEEMKVDSVALRSVLDWAIQTSYVREVRPGVFVPGSKLLNETAATDQKQSSEA